MRWLALAAAVVIGVLAVITGEPRLRVEPRAFLSGATVALTCTVPATDHRLRVWVGIQNVGESEVEFDSERIETIHRSWPVYCGAGDAYCIMSTGQQVRVPLTIGGC